MDSFFYQDSTLLEFSSTQVTLNLKLPDGFRKTMILYLFCLVLIVRVKVMICCDLLHPDLEVELLYGILCGI